MTRAPTAARLLLVPMRRNRTRWFGVARFVEKQGRRTGGIEDDYVEIAIVVDVAKGGAAARLEGAIIEPGAIRNFVESPVSQVAEQLHRLAILDFLFERIHQG